MDMFECKNVCSKRLFRKTSSPYIGAETGEEEGREGRRGHSSPTFRRGRRGKGDRRGYIHFTIHRGRRGGGGDIHVYI